MERNDNSIFQEAEYKEQSVEEFRGNPLIEALDLLSTEEIMRRLGQFPEVNSDVSKLNDQERLQLISKIDMLYQPLERDLLLASKLAQIIRRGYVNRNPLQKNKKIHGFSSNGLSIIGPSGIGKSSSISAVFELLFPQVIAHSSYKNKIINFVQLVYLTVETPMDGSLKGLLYEILFRLDQVLGTDYYSKHANGRRTIDQLIITVSKIVSTHGGVSLGILCIDEINNLSLLKSGGEQKVLNFIVTLTNTIGLPVVLIGNPSSLSFLNKSLRQARRAMGDICQIWNRLQKDSAEWNLMVNTLSRYQFVKTSFKIDEAINTALYECSQGIIDLLIKVYVSAQTEAILSGSEVINAQAIYQTFEKNFKMVESMLNALRTQKKSDLLRYDDLSVDAYLESRSTFDGSRLTGSISTNNSSEFKSDSPMPKPKKKRVSYELNTLRQNDLRLIVSTAKENKVTAYDGLKDKGLISDLLFLRLEA